MTSRATNCDSCAHSPDSPGKTRRALRGKHTSNGAATAPKSALDYENMSVFEQIREGLRQSIAYSRGEISLRSTTLTLPDPAPKLSRTRVVAIRKKTGMSQNALAAYLNVPKRTLESWDQGR